MVTKCARNVHETLTLGNFCVLYSVEELKKQLDFST